MKTRIIQTRFWDDDTVHSVGKDSNHLWIYLITNKELGMTNYIRIPDPFIQVHTKLSAKELQLAKLELQATRKVFFYKDWIFIPNLERENKYRNSPLNENVYQRELSQVPSDVKAWFSNVYENSDTTIDTTIDSTIDSTQKQETINNKPETIIPKEGGMGGEFLEFWEKYPRKEGRGKVEQLYKKLKENHTEIMEGLEKAVRYWKVNETERKFIPHPTTWLNQQRWKDELNVQETELANIKRMYGI